MSDADDAYRAAERLIEEAAREGSDYLVLGGPAFRALARLPPSIAGRSWALSLDLNFTQVSDLTPIARFKGLMSLSLVGTPVSDISVLYGMSDLKSLYADHSRITDLRPLANLTNLTVLALDHTPTSDLTPLADLPNLFVLSVAGTEIEAIGALAKLTTLSSLSLAGTRVTLLEPLSGLRQLRHLDISSIPATDLRPLRRLLLLAESPKFPGLTFNGCGATLIDSRIDEISRIKDPAERARTLFAYLEDWVPPVAPTQAAPFPLRTPTPLGQVVAKASVAEVRQVLTESYPDLRARVGQLVALVQQEQAVHALVPVPNSDIALQEYAEKRDFLVTMLAGLMSLADDLPETPPAQISDDKALTIRQRLVDLADTANRCVDWLDNNNGTFGGLWKLGLISSVAGLLALIPGVTFLTGAVLPAAVLGVQTLRVRIGRDKD